MSHDNPFGDSGDPFNDPSVQQASAYNPFEAQAVAGVTPKNGSAYLGQGSREMAPLAPTAAAADYNGIKADELAIREAALAKKEQELLNREKRVQQMISTGQVALEKNWPSKCWPIERHSINEDIPDSYRPLCRKLYATCLFTWLCLVWNWLCLMIRWGVIKDDTSTGSDALWSSIYLVLGSLGAWRLWYLSIYKAFSTKSTTQWMWFFVVFSAHCIFAIIIAVGTPDCAAAGVLVMLKSWDKAYLGIMCLVCSCLWGLLAFVSISLLKVSHSVWKGAGGEGQLKRAAAKAAVEQSLV